MGIVILLVYQKKQKKAGWSYNPETHKFVFAKPGISVSILDRAIYDAIKILW